MRASSLGRLVSSITSAKAYEIMKWNGVAWESILSNDGGITWFGTDFSLSPGIGYVIKITDAPPGGVALALTGMGISSSVSVALGNGVRLISVPYSSTAYTASSLGDAITSQGGGSTRCYTVLHWRSDQQRMRSHHGVRPSGGHSPTRISRSSPESHILSRSGMDPLHGYLLPDGGCVHLFFRVRTKTKKMVITGINTPVWTSGTDSVRIFISIGWSTHGILSVAVVLTQSEVPLPSLYSPATKNDTISPCTNG